MNILVVGGEARFRECCDKFGPAHRYRRLDGEFRSTGIADADVVFDFEAQDGSDVAGYRDFVGALFLDGCKASLAAFFKGQGNLRPRRVFGFNGMPTFLRRRLFEMSLLHPAMQDAAAEICSSLATDFRIVEDRVGLVSGRVIAMIINEAYYAAQEGVASRADINKAMRLGTSYPMGPFEWAEQIGLQAVYELITALYDDTHDERYKVCPELKKEYLLAQ